MNQRNGKESGSAFSSSTFGGKRPLAWLLFLPIALGLTGRIQAQNAPTNEEAKTVTINAETQTIIDFIKAFNSKDVDAVMAFFTEDAIYHNMPTGPVQGTQAVRNLITFFVAPAETLDWEILNIASVGSTVLTERIDRFVIKGKTVELPVMGAFELRDGKIAAWRDYFDMATWTRQNRND